MMTILAMSFPSFTSLLYIVFAILGLSFLIFIHELGHYFMARRLGMRVETFSIGFGRPLYSWVNDGVKWQIGWLLFGGYVKIAGAETAEDVDPYKIEDGFFGKGPWARIKVAFMGPFVNIVFAFLAFSAVWLVGGRQKNFTEYTHKLGWIDPKSELYQKGVRPGDEITSYDNLPFNSAKDHIMAPMTLGETIDVKGLHASDAQGNKEPFSYKVKHYQHPTAFQKDFFTLGILQPASYLLYDKWSENKDNPLPAGSPLADSGIQYGDRIVWIDGEKIYSLQQLTHLLNDSRVYLTVERKGEIIFRRVPRIQAEELRWDANFKEELIDWQFEAGLNQIKIQQLYTIPYNLTNTGVVEAPVKFIEAEKEAEAFPAVPFSSLEAPLLEGDKILAVSGVPVTHSSQILAQLQQHLVNIIVKRGAKSEPLASFKDADKVFDHEYSTADLTALAETIGLSKTAPANNTLALLKPVAPKTRHELRLASENALLLTDEWEAQQHAIEKIEDPEKRAQLSHFLENQDKQFLIGLPAVQDKKVQFNPGPVALFGQVFDEIWQTLKALVTGSLNPKWMSGPLGIVQVVHDHSMVSWKEAIFWLGAISLNLGFLNLLPMPVLDGGTICFAFYELITGQKIKAKTMEKLILPFAVLLIGFFFFLTYHDFLRIFAG